MKKALTLILAVIMLVSVLSACAGNTEPGAAPTPDQTPSAAPDEPENASGFTFTDDAGREIEVDAEITRILPSGPISQLALFAIAPEMLVGINSEWNAGAEDILPKEYLELPVIGQIYGGTNQINLEELAFLDPQLVIDVGQAKGSIVDDLNGMQEQTGVTFAHIDATLEGTPEAYRRLGKLIGKEEAAEELASFLENVWDRTQAIMEEVGDNKIKTVYCLNMEGMSVYANSAFHSEMVDLITDNVAVVEEVSTKGTGNPIDLEQLLVWDPELIIFAPDGAYDFASEPEWQALTAIQNGSYIEVPSQPENWMGSPPSVQRYLSLIWLPAALYPDYVDYDVYEECAKYYELFYHTELTRDMFDVITANSFIK